MDPMDWWRPASEAKPYVCYLIAQEGADFPIVGMKCESGYWRRPNGDFLPAGDEPTIIMKLPAIPRKP